MSKNKDTDATAEAAASATVSPAVSTKPAAKPEKSDRELAEYAVRCLYGCGIPESQSRLAGYSEATIKLIADAEREKRRDRVPNILAQATATKPEQAKTPPAKTT